ncbi:hypothetical protein MEJ65_00640 [Candidatus Carsonella ruddii]|uniref:Uncharacterized protein n=1 Tax=Carsonella ruddii TaxID=114186 RepID=A0AAJ6FL68_CARRU|nr:hypothetical protein [Candidatus Carsonella ruddii]WGS66585.1 hypothetical protein MEJ66_00650 [Candidatus Carsonella ruddii]WGS66783.1 hypothetical protein MEJ62_00635 [Candidatus Carsonella ruddii]WGS66974.1 hypothetical protein MEJ60_00635 [Candidatus Carsonella ruddii]WGS67165.1 hypothetical protein MEJ65_00640 [Candidatus Carsonella ruddii]WMC18181.1 MAG: hypothetical protein NU472_00645 [Candidatus Carsonella ruddii]
MNFQIFKILSVLGCLLFNINLLFLTKKFNKANDFSYYLNKFLFSKSFKFKIFYFFFFICLKYIRYGNKFICYYILWFFNIYLEYNFKNFKKKRKFKKKSKLINIIKIENFKIFKTYCKIRRNLIRKYNLNLTRKIVEKNSLQKLLKSILL